MQPHHGLLPRHHPSVLITKWWLPQTFSTIWALLCSCYRILECLMSLSAQHARQQSPVTRQAYVITINQ
jgi:hypothetical protein